MKFVAIAVTAIKVGSNVVLYYAAVDALGRAWWWDSRQPAEKWQPLPAHPGTTSGSPP